MVWIPGMTPGQKRPAMGRYHDMVWSATQGHLRSLTDLPFEHHEPISQAPEDLRLDGGTGG